ncbi:general stress protein [Bacillus sp. CECT 9360]|uniref:general stress protein n=1 Tax=Bacillus sp. CECT 9360 TaxID=2845821 RepID=UPI001E4D4158|nr:general stress protein [Bacillus sp. CECT 9360]CAH0345018.1 General stress protein 17M [Bacillus sp. CECT 9360]
MYQVHVIENGVQAKEKIDHLLTSGYSKENLYLFAHDKNRSEHLTENTDTEGIGMKEQGLLDSVGNMFKSRGDELRSKMSSLGLSKTEAEQYEVDLDKGKVVLVASKEVN